MKITSAEIYALNIPLVEAFSHSLHERDRAESVVVKVETDCGISGYGEGAPRPYVTGETQATSVEQIRDTLLPAIIGVELGDAKPADVISLVDTILPRCDRQGAVAFNASRCAVELALVDCLLKASGSSLGSALRPGASQVVYSGVIGSGSVAGVEMAAKRFSAFGLRHVKVKVCGPRDREQVAVVRYVMGPGVSIRLDANGAFTREEALRFLSAVAKYDIASIEQPMPRGSLAELPALRRSSPVPVMVDESMVTVRDAAELIEREACDLFNLRISKCGGLHDTLSIARLAASAGVGIQLGCQVGESAILSAAGRHVAAHLEGLRFVEGSYGTHLLVEDVAEEDVAFGRSGVAPVLTAPGLGIRVRDDVLAKYSGQIVRIRQEARSWAC